MAESFRMTLPRTREGWIAYFADTLPRERVSKAIDCLLSVQAEPEEPSDTHCDAVINRYLSPRGAFDAIECTDTERGIFRAGWNARAALNAKESP